jgi:hypothetical protein
MKLDSLFLFAISFYFVSCSFGENATHLNNENKLMMYQKRSVLDIETLEETYDSIMRTSLLMNDKSFSAIWTHPIPPFLGAKLINEFNDSAQKVLEHSGNQRKWEIVLLSSLRDSLGNQNDIVNFYFLSIDSQLRVGIQIGNRSYLIDSLTNLLINATIVEQSIKYNHSEKVALDKEFPTPNGQSICIKTTSQKIRDMINAFTPSTMPSSYIGLYYSQLSNTINPEEYENDYYRIPQEIKAKFNSLKTINHNNISLVFLPIISPGIINPAIRSHYDVSDICPPTCNN